MEAKIEELIGKTFTVVENLDNEELVFSNDDEKYIFYHRQDCCELVVINDICGDLDDIIGSPILKAEERISTEDDYKKVSDYTESFTWTFYEFTTNKGSVTVRWFGESNGYYSESVDLRKEIKNEN